MALQIRSWRQFRALSQSELSALAGLSVATVSRAEAGVRPPRPRVLRALAQALGVAPEDLTEVPDVDRQLMREQIRRERAERNR